MSTCLIQAVSLCIPNHFYIQLNGYCHNTLVVYAHNAFYQKMNTLCFLQTDISIFCKITYFYTTKFKNTSHITTTDVQYGTSVAYCCANSMAFILKDCIFSSILYYLATNLDPLKIICTLKSTHTSLMPKGQDKIHNFFE